MEPVSKRIPNKKHRLFIDELFKKNMNQTAAYQAVYDCAYDTARANSSALLADTNISEEVERRLKDNALSADEVISRLSEMARSDHTEFILKDGSVDLPKLITSGKSHLIKGTKWDKEGRLVVEFYNAHDALVNLGKWHNLFTDRVEHTGPDGGPIEIREIIAEMPNESMED